MSAIESGANRQEVPSDPVNILLNGWHESLTGNDFRKLLHRQDDGRFLTVWIKHAGEKGGIVVTEESLGEDKRWFLASTQEALPTNKTEMDQLLEQVRQGPGIDSIEGLAQSIESLRLEPAV